MENDLQSLIEGFLDDSLSYEESQRLNALLMDSPEFVRRFAQSALLHDRLRGEMQAQSAPWVELPAGWRARSLRGRWAFTSLTAIAAAVLLGFFFWHGGTATSASAASVALDRIIEVASQAVDRVYRIRVTDHGPQGAAPPVFSGKFGRKPGIDGAELYVRGSDQFVLIRHFGDGTDFITGSDGTLGWSVPAKGAVHLSHDPRRFRRAVPGEHEELTFTDLRNGLNELRRSYDLKLVPPDELAEPKSRGWSRLDAVKRGRYRGPAEVRIWFDPDGVAQRIELKGLPQDEGRAQGVVLELVEQRDLGPDFFKHERHHAATRPVDWQ